MKFAQVITLLSLLGLAACGPIKNMDEMHDATNSMATTTDHMSKTTEEMKGKTEDLYHTTLSTYTDLRQGNSLIIRADALNDMEKYASIESKIDEAGMYYMAFEFQLWKNYGPDTEKAREALYLEAAQQFFRDIHRYMDADRSTDPASTNPAMQNLFALAVALHQLNPNQEAMAEKSGIANVSMLSLIKGTLAKQADVESGKIAWDSVKEYEREILTNAKDAIYMLQLRANFLPMMVLAKLTPIETMNFFEKVKLLLFDYDANWQQLNLAQVKEYTRWINEASATVTYLSKLGESAQIDSKVTKLYGHLRLPAPSVSRASRDAALNGLLTALADFRKTMAIGPLDAVKKQ